MTTIERIRDALVAGEDEEVRRLTEEALGGGVAAEEILNQGLLPGMDLVGERFRTREIFLPEVLLAARAMYAGVDLVRPRLTGSGAATRGTIVIGTVQGDLHDIGKNLVAILLRGAGFEVVDLGHDVSPAAFVAAAREKRADVVGMSALLTTTMPVMGKVVAAIKESGLTQVRTIIGGAAVSEVFAKQIGADGYGYDAARAVEIVRAWKG